MTTIPNRSDARPMAMAGAVITLALALRVWAALMSGGVWRDEANDIFICREATSVSRLVEILRSEGSPVLRFVPECALHRLFPESIAPARVMVVVFGSAAMAMLLLMTWQALGPTAALLAGLLAATSPFFIRYGVELRGYAQFQLLAAAYAWTLVRLMERTTGRRAVLAGLTGGALALTHYYGLFLVTIGTGVTVLRSDKRAVAAASGAVAALAFLPWVPLLIDQSTGLRPWAVPNRKGLDALRVLGLPLGPWALWLAAGLVLVALWPSREPPIPDHSARRRRDVLLLLLVGGIGGNVLAWTLQFAETMRARLEAPYLAGMALWVVPVLGAGLARLPAIVPAAPRGGRALVGLALVAAFAGQAADVRAWLRPRTPMAHLVRTIEEQSRADDVILLLPAPLASTFNFYYAGTLRQWAPPFRGRITHVPWRELARTPDPSVLAAFERDLAAHLDSGGRVWLVNGGTWPAVAATIDRADLPPPRSEFEAVDRRIRERLLVVLHAHGRAASPAGQPSGRYWEPAGLWLFERR